MNATTSTPATKHYDLQIYRLGGAHEAKAARAIMTVDEAWMADSDKTFPQSKLIWLPGTEPYPVQCLEQCGETLRLVGIMLEKNSEGPGRKPWYFNSDISKRLFDVLLHQGRARSRRKILPSFNLTRATWWKQFPVGSGEWTSGSLWSKIYVRIDEISGLSDEVDGSYALVDFHGAKAYGNRTIIDEINNTGHIVIERELAATLGQRTLMAEGDLPLQFYTGLAKKIHKKFPWC
jgi:hypothetical protein